MVCLICQHLLLDWRSSNCPKESLLESENKGFTQELPHNFYNPQTTGNYKSIIAEGVAIISFEEEDDDGNITDKIVEITPDDLDWEVDSTDERSMGPEIGYAATYYFDTGEIEWNVWEYPMGATNYSDYKIEGGTLVKNFDSLEVNNEEFYEDEEAYNDEEPD